MLRSKIGEPMRFSIRFTFALKEGCEIKRLVAENFHITGLNMHPEIINSLAYIKKASAITNCEVGILEKKKAQAIVQACDEIIEGKFHDDFIVDPIQGGAGTSLNMNANEVIANRAIEILGGKKEIIQL